MSTIVKEDFLENLESSGLIIPYSHLRLLDCVGQGIYCTHMTVVYVIMSYRRIWSGIQSSFIQ